MSVKGNSFKTNSEKIYSYVFCKTLISSQKVISNIIGTKKERKIKNTILTTNIVIIGPPNLVHSLHFAIKVRPLAVFSKFGGRLEKLSGKKEKVRNWQWPNFFGVAAKF